MGDVERADAKGLCRAIICYMMAGVLLLQAVVRPDQLATLGRSSLWIAMIFMAGLCLTPFVGIALPRRLRTLLNDETTREHRRIAMNAAFWATLLSAAAITVVGAASVIPTFQAVRIVVTATLVSALVSFATLELRAAR